jgi:hypothetical protein
MIPTTGEAASDRSIFLVGPSGPDRSPRRIEPPLRNLVGEAAETIAGSMSAAWRALRG